MAFRRPVPVIAGNREKHGERQGEHLVAGQPVDETGEKNNSESTSNGVNTLNERIGRKSEAGVNGEVTEKHHQRVEEKVPAVKEVRAPVRSNPLDDSRKENTVEDVDSFRKCAIQDEEEGRARSGGDPFPAWARDGGSVQPRGFLVGGGGFHSARRDQEIGLETSY